MLLLIGPAGLYIAGAGAVPVDATTGISDAHGALSMTASHRGAILRARNLAPGESVSGEASVLGATRSEGPLRLEARNLSVRGGGDLAKVLRLRVEDKNGDGRVVFDGTLRGLRNVSLGQTGNGRQHTYRFTATLPTRAGDEYSGASVSADFVWSTASASGSEARSRSGARRS